MAVSCEIATIWLIFSSSVAVGANSRVAGSKGAVNHLFYGFPVEFASGTPLAMVASSSLKRMLIFLTAFTILNVVHATPVMHRPANVSAPLHTFKTEEHPIVHEIHKRATGKVSMGMLISHSC